MYVRDYISIKGAIYYGNKRDGYMNECFHKREFKDNFVHDALRLICNINLTNLCSEIASVKNEILIDLLFQSFGFTIGRLLCSTIKS